MTIEKTSQLPFLISFQFNLIADSESEEIIPRLFDCGINEVGSGFIAGPVNDPGIKDFDWGSYNGLKV
jgi:hypothetical protein